MKILIIYHERLGDIARCLPLARHFHTDGHEVFIECLPQYHGLFDIVGYAAPISPDTVNRSDFDLVHDLQIWPRRFNAFTASGLDWMDFIYQLFTEVDREIVFDKLLPITPEWVSETCLVFPNGYSQRQPPDPAWVMLTAHELFPGVPIMAVGKRELGCYELPDIPTLIAWIADAKHVLTINTATSILASAVRDSWHHIPDSDDWADWHHPRRIVVPRQS